MSSSASFQERGYLVLPVPINVQSRRNAILSALNEIPEYKEPHFEFEGRNNTVFVLGGFGALANPSSFHHPAVRAIRYAVHNVGIQVLRSIAEEGCGEQLIDRLCIRRKGTSTSAETWHRDQSTDRNSVILGGWVNLDPTSQYFTCVPGTHRDAPGPSGFATISKEEHKRYKDASVVVEIPSGHMILFYQNIVHNVTAKKMYIDSLRLFTGWRVSYSHTALFDQTKPEDYPSWKGMEQMFKDQGAVPLPSGQYPPMYAKLHLVNYIDATLDWSNATMKDECTEMKMIKGESKRIVKRFMPSLKELGLPLYPEYHPAELSMHQPKQFIKPPLLPIQRGIGCGHYECYSRLSGRYQRLPCLQDTSRCPYPACDHTNNNRFECKMPQLCISCGEENIGQITIVKRESKDIYVDTHQTWKILTCRQCGTSWPHPNRNTTESEDLKELALLQAEEMEY